MRMNLHANATTPKIRAYIQTSTAPAAELVAELGVSYRTIYRWRKRGSTEDRSRRPKRMSISLTALEEELVCELRTQLDLPLDDIVESLSPRRCCVPPD